MLGRPTNVLRALDALDVRRVEPFGASLDLELDFLSFGEGLEPVHHGFS